MGNVAVTNIVDSDTLYARFFCSSCHFSVQAALGYKEHPLVHTDIVELSEIVLYFLDEKLRHGDDTVALFCFGSGDNITSIQTLIGLVDAHRAFLEIEVCRCECQQLALTDTAPVKHFKCVVELGFVHHHFCEFQIFLFCPEQHFSVFLLAHAAGFPARIFFEVIELYRMVEDGAELIVDGFKVYGRKRLSVFVFIIHQLVLPCYDLLGGDIAHLQLAEVR